MKSKFTKYIYLVLVILGVFYLIEKSIGQAMVPLGIALAFDPFNPEQSWADRPVWQKMTLLVHLAIVFGLVFIEIFNLLA
ncbi:hypothetical protein V7S78_01410 [Aquirufa regiilacus]